MSELKKCPECTELFSGRTDKKFCSSYCKSAYHYRTTKENESSLFIQIDKQLKENRRLLKDINKAGLSIIHKEKLLNLGFNPTYFTHYWKATNGNVYLFCYEFGFMEVKDPTQVKYVLILWQSYMNKKIK